MITRSDTVPLRHILLATAVMAVADHGQLGAQRGNQPLGLAAQLAGEAVSFVGLQGERSRVQLAQLSRLPRHLFLELVVVPVECA